MEEGISLIKKAWHIDRIDDKRYSPIVLAYMGDCVYELIIRSVIVISGNMQVEKMSKKCVSFVNHTYQARLIHAIEDMLTDDEMSIYKRGRNGRIASMPRRATVSEYRAATGLESLMGYLYINNKLDRCIELIREGISRLDDK